MLAVEKGAQSLAPFCLVDLSLTVSSKLIVECSHRRQRLTPFEVEGQDLRQSIYG